MQHKPVIRTAIPKRRWQVGDYGASLLGDIESGDGAAYRWILAFVRMGRREPELYVCAEGAPPEERAKGAWRLKLVSESLFEVLDTDDRWGDAETFAAQALKVGAQMLGLQRERTVQLS